MTVTATLTRAVQRRINSQLRTLRRERRHWLAGRYTHWGEPWCAGPGSPYHQEPCCEAALQAGTGLQQLLAFRHDCTTVTTPAEQAAGTAGLTSAAAELGKAAEALHGLIELAEITGRSGRTGKTDLNGVQPAKADRPPSPQFDLRTGLTCVPVPLPVSPLPKPSSCWKEPVRSSDPTPPGPGRPAGDSTWRPLRNYRNPLPVLDCRCKFQDRHRISRRKWSVDRVPSEASL
jgi:hypothetical protein